LINSKNALINKIKEKFLFENLSILEDNLFSKRALFLSLKTLYLLL